MILTEDEAKKKWCPFALLPTIRGSNFNRDVGPDCVAPEAMCIGSRCMAWHAHLNAPGGLGFCGMVRMP